jgi:amidohydrolase family protein/carbon-nitrogen hydrolase
MTGGHGHFMGYEADGVEAVRRAAREQLKAGAHGIKLMANAGLAVAGEHPTTPELREEELGAAVTEARNQGKWVAASAHSSTAIKNAARAGVDSIEHGTYLDDEAIKLMLERNVTLVPTFAIYHRMAHASADSGLAKELRVGAREVVEQKIPLFLSAHRAGVRIVTGTDNGPPLGPHGDLALELILMAEVGMRPIEVIRAATIASMTTAWPMQGDDPETDYYGYTFDILSRANALSNQLWMVCANQVNRPPTPGCPNYYGHSRIIAPNGKIEAEIGYEEGVVSATVDLLGGIERGRTRDFFGLNLLQDRRPEFYGLLAQRDIYYRSEVEPLVHQAFKGSASESSAEVPLAVAVR